MRSVPQTFCFADDRFVSVYAICAQLLTWPLLSNDELHAVGAQRFFFARALPGDQSSC